LAVCGVVSHWTGRRAAEFGGGCRQDSYFGDQFQHELFAPALTVKRGFFKEEGIEAEVIRMNANVAITALASGDTDYTMIFGSVVRAAIRGLPVKVVASSIDGSTHALVSRPE
jgi:NMT1/THI5 like